MADEINTGGGPAVDGNAETGRDFVGRDRVSYNTQANLGDKADWMAFFLMDMRSDVNLMRRNLEEARIDRARMDTKIDRNHDYTAQRFSDADVHFSKQLNGIWSWLIALIVGSSAHLVAIIILIVVVYMLWQTVHGDALTALHRLAWIWGIP